MNTNIDKCKLLNNQLTKGIQKLTQKVFKNLHLRHKRYSKTYTYVD